jgi:hypothetical protein
MVNFFEKIDFELIHILRCSNTKTQIDKRKKKQKKEKIKLKLRKEKIVQYYLRPKM